MDMCRHERKASRTKANPKATDRQRLYHSGGNRRKVSVPLEFSDEAIRVGDGQLEEWMYRSTVDRVQMPR